MLRPMDASSWVGPSYSNSIPVAAVTLRTASNTSSIEPGGARSAFTT